MNKEYLLIPGIALAQDHKDIHMNLIKEIKSRHDIVEIAGQHLQLQRSGVNWKARCPFHDDKSPSLVIFPESQRWICFGMGCSQGGDLIDLLQRLKKWDFPTTLRHLAEAAGIALPPLSEEQVAGAGRRCQLEQVLGAAMVHFQQHLFRPFPLIQGVQESEIKPDLGYALSRGWSKETLAMAGVGSFSRDREALRRSLRTAGVDLECPAAVALLGWSGDVEAWASRYDLAPSRSWVRDNRIPAMPADMLIYPHLERGRTLYLSGRGVDEKRHWNPPHELVGPRQPYYNACWWGAAKETPVLLVEGQGDALTLAHWGMPAVALAGCSLGASSRQAGARAEGLLGELLEKAASAPIVIALDADEAGQTASWQVAAALEEAGVPAHRLLMLAWPKPDANQWLVAGAGAEDARQLVASSPTRLDELLRVAGEAPGDVPAMQAVFRALVPLDEYELVRFEDKVCQRMKLRRSQFEQLLRSARIQLSQEAGGGAPGSEAENPSSLVSQDGASQLSQAGAYLVTPAGTYLRRYNQQGCQVLEKLSNFSARIEQEIRRDDGLEVEREFRIAGQMDGVSLSLARVKAGEFDQMDWVMREWGHLAIVEAGIGKRDQLRSAIQHMSRDFERRTIFMHCGWRDLEGGRAYLSASGGLGGQDLEVDLDCDLKLYRLPERPQDPLEAVKASLQFIHLAPLKVSAPLWASIWLAPLGEIIPPVFVVWLYGRTGSLKSTLASLVMNHFGPDFDEFHFPASFLDTTGRLEQKAFLAKDAVLVVDDYAPQRENRSAQEYKRTASYLVRAAGNRAGRGRLTREIKARPSYTPRGLLMVTGEDLPETESLVARLFIVEFTSGCVDMQRLSEMQAHRQLYSHAMCGYLGWLKEHWKAYVDILPKRFLHYRKEASVSGAHLRLPDNIAALMLGWEMGLRYALSIEALPSAEYKQLMDSGWAALLESGADMSKMAGDEKPEEMFLGTFRELLAQGAVYLRQREGGSILRSGSPEGALSGSAERGEMLGWYDEAYLYLLPEASYARISRHFREQGGSFPVRRFTLQKCLREAGLLVERQGRMARSEWIDGRSQMVLVLKRSVLGEV